MGESDRSDTTSCVLGIPVSSLIVSILIGSEVADSIFADLVGDLSPKPDENPDAVLCLFLL